MICFSADGSLLLAAGQSNFICIYSVAERLVLKKLRLTTNRSLDGVTVDFKFKTTFFKVHHIADKLLNL